MSWFSAPLLQTSVLTAFRSAGVLYVNSTTGSNRRYQIYEVEMGQSGSLASTDIQNLWDLSRIGASAGIAGASVTPNLFDNSDVSPGVAVYFNALTGEPTYTTAGNGLSIKQWPINQRGFYRWRALDNGDNIVIPAVAFSGIGVRTLSGSANSNQTAMGAISYIER